MNAYQHKHSHSDPKERLIEELDVSTAWKGKSSRRDRGAYLCMRAQSQVFPPLNVDHHQE